MEVACCRLAQRGGGSPGVGTHIRTLLVLLLLVSATRGEGSTPVVELGEEVAGEESMGASLGAMKADNAAMLRLQLKQDAQARTLEEQRREYFKLDPTAEAAHRKEKAHMTQRESTLNHVADTVKQVQDIVATTADDQPTVQSPEAAAEEKDANTVQHALDDQVHKAEELAVMGKALKAEEEEESCIGLVGTQHDDFSLLELNKFVCGALEKTNAESVEAAQQALLDAQHHLAIEKKKKEVRDEQQRQQILANQEAQVMGEKRIKDFEAQEATKEQQTKHAQRETVEKQEKGALQEELAARKKKGKEVEAKLMGEMRQLRSSKMNVPVPGKSDIEISRATVIGDLTPENMRKACNDIGYIPVCDSYDAYDGSCLPIDNGNTLWHFSNDTEFMTNTKNILDKVNYPERVYFYAGGIENEDGSPSWGIHSGSGLAATPGTNINNTAQTYCSKVQANVIQTFKFKGVDAVRLPIKGQVTTATIEKTCSDYGNGMRPLCESYAVLGGRCVWPAGAYEEHQAVANPSSDAQTDPFNALHFRWSVFFAASYPRAENVSNAPILNFGIGSRRSRFTYKDGYTICAKISPKWHTLHSKVEFNGKTMTRVKVDGTMTSNTAKTACQSKQMVPICDQFSQFDGTCALLSSLVKFSDPISTSRAGLPQEALAGTYFYTGYNGGGLHTSAYNGGYFSVDESKGARDGETWCVPDVGQSFRWKGYMFETVKVPKIISGLAASAQCVQHGEGWTAVCSALQFYKNEHSAIRCQPFDAGIVQSPSRKTVMQTFATDGKEYLDKVRGSLLYNELSTMTTLQPLGIITDNPQGDLTQTKSRYVGTYTLCIKRPGEWLAKQGKFSVGTHIVRRVTLPNHKATSKSIYKTCKAQGLLPVCGNKVWDGTCIPLDIFPLNATNDPSTKTVTNMIVKNTTATQDIMGNWEMRVMGTNLYQGTNVKWNTTVLDSLYVSPDGTNFLHRYGFETLCATEPLVRDPFEFNGFMIHPTKVQGSMDDKNILHTCKSISTLRRPACAHRSSFSEVPTGAYESTTKSNEGFCINTVCKNGQCDYPRGDASAEACRNTCYNRAECKLYAYKKQPNEGSGVDCMHFPNCDDGIASNEEYITFEKSVEKDSACFVIDPGINADLSYRTKGLGVNESPIRFSKPKQMKPLVADGKIISSFNYFFYSGHPSGRSVYNGGEDGWFSSGQQDRWTWCAEKITRAPTLAPTVAPSQAPTYQPQILPLHFNTRCWNMAAIKILGYNQTKEAFRDDAGGERDTNFACRGMSGYWPHDRQEDLGEVDFDRLHDGPERRHAHKRGHSPPSRQLLNRYRRRYSYYNSEPTGAPTPPTVTPTFAPTFHSCSLERCKEFCFNDPGCQFMGYVNSTGKCYQFKSMDSCRSNGPSEKSDIYFRMPGLQPKNKYRNMGKVDCIPFQALSGRPHEKWATQDRHSGKQVVLTDVDSLEQCQYKCDMPPQHRKDWAKGKILSTAPACNYVRYSSGLRQCIMYSKCYQKKVPLSSPAARYSLYVKSKFDAEGPTECKRNEDCKAPGVWITRYAWTDHGSKSKAMPRFCGMTATLGGKSVSTPKPNTKAYKLDDNTWIFGAVDGKHFKMVAVNAQGTMIKGNYARFMEKKYCNPSDPNSVIKCWTSSSERSHKDYDVKQVKKQDCGGDKFSFQRHAVTDTDACKALCKKDSKCTAIAIGPDCVTYSSAMIIPRDDNGVGFKFYSVDRTTTLEGRAVACVEPSLPGHSLNVADRQLGSSRSGGFYLRSPAQRQLLFLFGRRRSAPPPPPAPVVTANPTGGPTTSAPTAAPTIEVWGSDPLPRGEDKCMYCSAGLCKPFTQAPTFAPSPAPTLAPTKFVDGDDVE